MTRKFFSNRSIAIAIIGILILSLISLGGAKAGSVKQQTLMDAVNPQLNASIAGLGKLIQKGEPPVVLQQQLEIIINRNKQFGDLFVINQDVIIVAANDANAVGLAYPISFRSNMFKGVLPLPFSYALSEMPSPNNSYTVRSDPGLMFKVFGTYKNLNNQPYHIVGSYHVDPALTSRLERISGFITLCMQVYRICFILFWLLLAIWVYQDARRRPTNAAAWGILTLLTSIIGWLVYLIARPMLNICSNCAQEQNSDLKFCTSCGTLLKNCCPECGSELKGGWDYCGSCGHKMDYNI